MSLVLINIFPGTYDLPLQPTKGLEGFLTVFIDCRKVKVAKGHVKNKNSPLGTPLFSDTEFEKIKVPSRLFR